MANREDVDLSAYLAPKGKAPGIGTETGTVVRDGISILKSPHGSNRYLLSKQGAAVGVLQVVEISPGIAVIANVYVSPEWRRKGIATKLYERAAKDFAISLPDKRMISKAGLAWTKGLKGFRKNGTVCQAEDLKNYLSQEIDYYDYAWMIDDWSEGEFENDYEALSDEKQKEFRKYVDESDEIDRLDTNAPAYRFFEGPGVLPEGSWLIHFTDKSFGSFKYGATLETLALSTHFSKQETSCPRNLSDEIGIYEVVWAFAMDATDSFRELKDACSQYGRNFLLFKTDCAVKAYHKTDNQWQCIFPICSEYDVFTGSMTRGGDVSLDTDYISGFDGAECESIEEAIEIAERALAGEFKNKKEDDDEEEEEEEGEELEPNKRIQLNFEEANKAAQEILNKMFDSIDPYWLESEQSKFGQLREYTLTDAFGGTVLPMKIRIGGLSVDVVLSAFNPRKPSVTSFNKGQASWKRRGRENAPTVEIELNGSHKVSHFKTWPAVREIEQVLRHELTHILDPKVMSGIKPSYSGGSSDAQYVNDSAEVKAFGNELADWLKGALSRKGYNSVEDQDARRYADELMAEAMKAWPYKLMTEANKRRIKKDAYLYLAGEDS